MATDIGARPLLRRRRAVPWRGTVPEQPLRFLEPALEIADGAHPADGDAKIDERLRDLRGQPRDDRAGAHEARRLNRLDQVVGDRHVDRGDAGDVDDDDPGAMPLNRPEQLLGELARTRRVEDPDDREDEQSLTNLQHRRGQLANRILLVTDDALAL